MWLSLSAMADLKLSLNMSQCENLCENGKKNCLKLSLTATSSYIYRVQRPGSRPRALAFPDPRPGINTSLF